MLNSYSTTLTKQTLFSTLILMLMFAISCQGVNNRYLGSLKYCQNISKQAFLTKVQQYQYNHVIEQQINSAFPANRNQFMQGIFQQNSQKSYESLKPYMGQYFLNIGTLLIIFLAFIILIPILFFSKCCSCCCVKPTQKYTDCQMKLPSFFIVLFAIALIVICSVVLKINLEYQPKVQDFKCSLGIITDDTLKGRQDRQLKWIGLEPYQMQVKDFIKQMEDANETILLNLSNTSKPMVALQKNINRLEDLMSKVPNNDKSELALYYPKPLLSAKPKTLTKSTLVQILGTKSIKNSLIQNTTSTVPTITSSLLELSSYSSSLYETLSKIQPSKIRRSLSQSIQSTQQIQTNIYSTISIAQKGLQKIYWIGSYVFLGLTIFITFIICIQVLCIGCKNQYACKSKLCCCCTLLWIVGLLHFLVAVGVAVGGLVGGQSCAYFRESFSNEQAYKNNVGKYLGSGNGIGSAIGKCLSSSKDPNYLFNNKISIQTQPALSNFSQFLNSPPLTLPNISQFQTQLQKANQTLRQFYLTQKLDITDEQMISQIQQIKYIDGCSSDVWVPSLKNQLSQSTNEINNQTASGVNNMTCPGLEKFGNRSEGCIFGVIDTTSIFGLANNKQNLIYSLENRYEKCPVPQRKFIVDNLTKIWQSYYSIKKDKLSPVLTRLSLVTQVMKSTKELLESTIYPSVNTSTKFLQNNLISSLKPSIPSPTTDNSSSSNSSNSSNASSESQSSTNSSSVPFTPQNSSPPTQNNKLAVKNNKDCRIIGKNIDVSIRIICSQGLNLIYTLRYLYYTSAVLIFMMSCLSICLMNRSENQQKIQLDMEKAQQNINHRQIARQNIYQAGTQRNLYFRPEIPRSHPYF